jgi:hypothetical protein
MFFAGPFTSTIDGGTIIKKKKRSSLLSLKQDTIDRERDKIRKGSMERKGGGATLIYLLFHTRV